MLIPVDLSQYPSNAEIASALLSHVPKGVHNVLIDFISRLYAVYVDSQFTYLEINPLVVIPSKDGQSADVHFLDLAAKLDQTAEFECGVKWAIARAPAALGMATGPADGKVTPPRCEAPTVERTYTATLTAALQVEGQPGSVMAMGAARKSVEERTAVQGACEEKARQAAKGREAQLQANGADLCLRHSSRCW